MQELKDIKLKKGDIVYYIDNCGERSTLLVHGYDGCSLKEFEENGFVTTKIERPVKYETIYEAPKPILDKEEKAYLEAVIRPFRDKVSSITKIWFYIDNKKQEEKEFIKIRLITDFDDPISLPAFEKGTMYKGMEYVKDYTLDELGLFKEKSDDN